MMMKETTKNLISKISIQRSKLAKFEYKLRLIQDDCQHEYEMSEQIMTKITKKNPTGSYGPFRQGCDCLKCGFHDYTWNEE